MSLVYGGLRPEENAPSPDERCPIATCRQPGICDHKMLIFLSVVERFAEEGLGLPLTLEEGSLLARLRTNR